jgi:lysophospholipase L1-like esterase
MIINVTLDAQIKLLLALCLIATCDTWHQLPHNKLEKKEMKASLDVKHEQTAEVPGGEKPEEPVRMPIKTGSTVLLLGDSLSLGLSSEFVSIVHLSGYVPAVHGITGSRADQWLTKIKKDLESYCPSLVLVSLGTNDVAAGIEWVKQHSAVYHELVKLINDSGARIVWIGPPKLDEKKLPNSDEVRDIIRAASPSYFESQNIIIDQASDGVHSSPAGYKKWMDAAWSWMVTENIVKSSLVTK